MRILKRCLRAISALAASGDRSVSMSEAQTATAGAQERMRNLDERPRAPYPPETPDPVTA